MKHKQFVVYGISIIGVTLAILYVAVCRPITPPSYRYRTLLMILKGELYRNNKLASSTVFNNLPVWKNRLTATSKLTQYSSSKDLVVYNPTCREGEKDWIVFIETSHVKLYEYNVSIVRNNCFVLWNDGRITVGDNKDQFIAGKLGLEYYLFESDW
jgi:hypothetical protein